MKNRKSKFNKIKNDSPQKNKLDQAENKNISPILNPEDFYNELICVFHQASGITGYFKSIPEQYIARLFQNAIYDAVYYSDRVAKKNREIKLDFISKAIHENEGVLKTCSEFDKQFFSYSEVIAQNLVNLTNELKKHPCYENLNRYYEWLIQSCKPISNALNRAFQEEKSQLLEIHPNFFFKISNSIINGCVTECLRRVGHILAVKQTENQGLFDEKTFDAIKTMLSVFATSGLVIHSNESVNLFYNNPAKDMLKIVLDRAFQVHGQPEKQSKTKNSLVNLGFNEENAKEIIGTSLDHEGKLKIKIPLTLNDKDKTRDLDLSPKSLAKIGVFHQESEKNMTDSSSEEIKKESIASLEQN